MTEFHQYLCPAPLTALEVCHAHRSHWHNTDAALGHQPGGVSLLVHVVHALLQSVEQSEQRVARLLHEHMACKCYGYGTVDSAYWGHYFDQLPAFSMADTWTNLDTPDAMAA